MRHLSDAELVDAAERTLTPSRMAHLDSCDRCRAAVGHLASTLRDVAEVDVPEPSPLFWDYFSNRVHEAVAAEQPAAAGSRWSAFLTPWVQIVAFCVVVIAVVSAAWVVRSSPQSAARVAIASASPAQGPSGAAASSVETAGLADDPAWAVLDAAAADLGEDASPSTTFTVRPAAVDTAVQQLTPQERNELGRLLQSEMKRSSD